MLVRTEHATSMEEEDKLLLSNMKRKELEDDVNEPASPPAGGERARSFGDTLVEGNIPK